MLSETKADEIGERAAEVLHADPFGGHADAGWNDSRSSFGGGKGGGRGGGAPRARMMQADSADLMHSMSRGGGTLKSATRGMSFGGPPPPPAGAAPMAMMMSAPPLPPPLPPPAAPMAPSSVPAPAAVPVSPVAATPTPEPAQPEPQPTDGAEGGGGGGVDVSAVVAGARDYTKVPAQMDRRFEALDEDGALRPTIIKPAEPWSKTSQNGKLLEKPTTRSLGGDDLEAEKVAAFDLIDALTRSGALPFEHAALHVVIAATHCFDRSVVETVVRANRNPIEKVERSALILAETIHQQPVDALLSDDDPSLRERVEAASPQLFPRLGSS